MARATRMAAFAVIAVLFVASMAAAQSEFLFSCFFGGVTPRWAHIAPPKNKKERTARPPCTNKNATRCSEPICPAQTPKCTPPDTTHTNTTTMNTKQQRPRRAARSAASPAAPSARRRLRTRRASRACARPAPRATSSSTASAVSFLFWTMRASRSLAPPLLRCCGQSVVC